MSQSEAPQASYFDTFSESDYIQQSDPFSLDTSSQTVSTVPIQEFTHPHRHSLAPNSLRRVGPKLQQIWILFDSDIKDPEMQQNRHEFVEWWLKTKFGLQENLRDGIHWDGKKKSDIWESFEQVAHEKTGEPKVMCKRCYTILAHPHHRRGGTSPLRTHIKGGTCFATKKNGGIGQLLQNMPSNLNRKAFSQNLLLDKLVKLITTARLLFRIVEHPEFKDFVETIQLAHSQIEIPSVRTIRRYLDTTVREQQETVLSTLPKESRLSIALDCWTSPFKQAFMAITGYFINQEWNYHEVLLGFEHIHGSHTGSNLSETVFQVLQEHGITDRVLSITTDNASNNNTMMMSIQDVIQSQGLANTSIFRIPCLAHVIQLSLKQLLGKMKVDPINQEVEAEWSDERTQSLQSNSRLPTRQIMDTLKKVRELAVFINASPQRREAFLSLQTKEPRLVPIQDVSTRWNSTFLMLERAKKLQSALDQYCTTHQYVQFKLDQEEWRQIEYLLLIMKPFFDYTNILSKTKDVTVHLIFSIYNCLFNHLEALQKQLRCKAVPWKKSMFKALKAAHQKLSEYYAATDNEAYGNIYAIATILSPSKKLQFFKSKDWQGENVDFAKQYREVLEKEFKQYQQQVSETTAPVPVQESTNLAAADDDDEPMAGLETPVQSEVVNEADEITRYLAKAPEKAKPRVFWKDHERDYPVLARLARDILSIPASGAGVERLFNCAHDVCHYHRGNLRPETIKELMLHQFSSKFELQQSALDMLKEHLSAGEAAMIDQARKPISQGPLTDLDPISDNEEEGNQEEVESDVHSDDDVEDEGKDEPSVIPVQIPIQSEQAQRKRPRSRNSKAIDDADNGLPLPEMPIGETTQARSGRIWKKPKLPEGFEIDKL